MTRAPDAALPDRPRILVIDDERDICETLEILLSSVGYEVATAESGASAIELAKGGVFHLAICDLRMPGMSGVDTVAALKRLHPDLVAMVVSGYASDATELRCREVGVARIIRKPFNLDDLLEMVSAAVPIDGAA